MKRVLIELKNIKKQYNNRVIIKDLDLNIYEGEFLTLLGSSGCGKTTILRMISGMEDVTSGSIFMNGKDITSLEPMKREINTIFQNYALFSHMTIEKNIGFGLKMKKVDKDEIKKEVKKMLSLIKLEGYENRKPSQLSGGEQQRVAIARALINNPKVLLLDEPLSALDKKLRKEMEIELKMLQQKLGITFIYVTHDQEEALTMSDRIIILKNGKIEQIDTPQNIYKYPKSKYVADFIGDSNIFDGYVKSYTKNKCIIKVDKVGEFEIENKNYEENDKVTIMIRPENFRIAKKGLEVYKKEFIYNGSTAKLLCKTKDNFDIIVSINPNDFQEELGDVLYLEWDKEDIVVINEKVV
ncbi:MAG: ABC transporter ATP-binding protein [Bacilli bacterium]|jgi:spermidine/putrescine transport system ATP-binding protein|nr:ABC transporter ATP-binding protein [Bacilli bacterium]